MDSITLWFDSIPIETKIMTFTIFFISVLVFLAILNFWFDYKRAKETNNLSTQPLPTSLQIDTTNLAVRNNIDEILTRLNLESEADRIVQSVHMKVALLNQRIMQANNPELTNFFFKGELGPARRMMLDEAKKQNSAGLYFQAACIAFVELDLNLAFQYFKKATSMDESNQDYEDAFNEISEILETRVKKKVSSKKPAKLETT